MLRIKRASAGSGKTYELAKTFIKLLISTKHSGYRRQLLKGDAFREALSGIMAVTFTVKATAEMKQRIVEKLADLSRADSASPEELKEMDYLKEFLEDFPGSDKYIIADLCRKALRTLLLHYSEFRVQTIDSFFQGILHTFAYEANLEDNFNMEINNDYVTAVGFDTTLDELSGSDGQNGEETLYWLRRMVEMKSWHNKWNVFARGDSKSSLYGRLIEKAMGLESEDFHRIRRSLEDYFDKIDRPFSRIFEEVDEANLGGIEEHHGRVRDAAARLACLLDSVGLGPEHIANRQKTAFLESQEPFDRNKVKEPGPPKGGRKADEGYSLSAVAFKSLKERIECGEVADSAIIGEIDDAFDRWNEARDRYYEAFNADREAVLTWVEYRALIPWLMVALEIARSRDAFLKATNTLQISDTTMILSRIISDDDAPFVYERMGTRLHHYLIDEFQDTSAMQWHNLKPLVYESYSTGNDNLIIGDAKQSIYRFRNADYTLISGLEREFPDHVFHTRENDEAQDIPNTNFRSKPCIVEFNNYVFSHIVNLDNGGKDLFTSDTKKVYEGCEQEIPPKTLRKVTLGGEAGAPGFVEMVFYRNKGNNSREEDDESGAALSPGFLDLPKKIEELVARGYSYRDIGVLVKSHAQGAKAMEAINAHNDRNPDKAIPVISEEDMLVASALSVKIIIHVLEVATKGKHDRVGKNPVLEDPVDEGELGKLLRSLNSLALPSITEAVIARFIPAKRRDEEAPFIAAFQDAVMEYCAGHSSDIGSFLKWWERKRKKLSIVSPEDSNGVRLQTIHKAKGLEFTCVIIPEANFTFTPGPFSEWKWVMTAPCVKKHELLPPSLPVETRASLENTIHAPELFKYRELYALDELNKMYVGFTRAVAEMYVYVPAGGNDATKAGGTLRKLLSPELLEGEDSPLPGAILDETESRTVVRYGCPSEPCQIMFEKRKEAEKAGKKTRATLHLERYNGRWTPYLDDNEEIGEHDTLFNNAHPLKVIMHPDGRGEELDPRAEGTLKHRVMQMVETPADLPAALRMMRVEGVISDTQAEAWERQLSEAIESVSARGWFSPEARVYNERHIIRKGEKTHIPDRFIVTPEGDAVIIDYKFGEHEKKNERQVRQYADLLRESGFNSVSAYLWYVTEGKILQVK